MIENEVLNKFVCEKQEIKCIFEMNRKFNM